MGILLRILQLAIAALLIVAVTGIDSMASAAFDDPCCEEERREQDEPSQDCGGGCSPFCVSCPSRTVTPVHPVAVPAGSVAISVVAAPEADLAFPSDPPRRGIFHPPRPSFSAVSR